MRDRESERGQATAYVQPGHDIFWLPEIMAALHIEGEEHPDVAFRVVWGQLPKVTFKLSAKTSNLGLALSLPPVESAGRLGCPGGCWHDTCQPSLSAGRESA